MREAVKGVLMVVEVWTAQLIQTAQVMRTVQVIQTVQVMRTAQVIQTAQAVATTTPQVRPLQEALAALE